jgi:DNA-binding transcriptional LysR family regulator
MDRLDALRSFRRVVELGGFSAAARDLGLSNAAISKHVAQLEGRLGARLLQRTTRRLSVTEAGQAYYERTARLLDDLAEADDAVSLMQAAPRGTLRVNAPMSFGIQYLAPVLPDFLERCPEVSIDLAMSDRVVDLLEEGFDVALRIRSGLPDSRLIAQKLAPVRRLVCAAPAYLARRGRPQQPADLARHDCLIYSLTDAPEVWDFDGPQGMVAIAVRGRLKANNGQALREAALAGIGIIRLPSFSVAPELKTGRLVEILSDWRIPAHEFYAVYPTNRHLAPKLRAFVDFLAERFSGAPWDEDCRKAEQKPDLAARRMGTI